MTDNLLQKLEERMMTLLAELENLRKETHRLKQENQNLKTEYTNHIKKLQNLVSLLDSLDGANVSSAMRQESEFVEEAEYVTA
jgi:regulator of replication initiation timing